jgi:hypothetical protein
MTVSGERIELVVPHTAIERESMDEHDRSPIACLFIVEPCAIYFGKSLV